MPVPPPIVGDEGQPEGSDHPSLATKGQPEGSEEGEIPDEMADDPPARDTAVVLAAHNGREFPACPAPATFDDIDC